MTNTEEQAKNDKNFFYVEMQKEGMYFGPLLEQANSTLKIRWTVTYISPTRFQVSVDSKLDMVNLRDELQKNSKEILITQGSSSMPGVTSSTSFASGASKM